MNEMANLSEQLGANIDDIRLGIGTDSRIGKRFLFPRIGYGGSCFPKDVQALAKMAEDADYDFRILKSVMEVNKTQKRVLIRKLTDYFAHNLTGKKIAIWGLAFKPNTDDIREAPALEIINALLEMGADVAAFDPEAMPNVKKEFGTKIDFVENPYNALVAADALVIMTEWQEFRSPDFNKIKNSLKAPVLFDGRNIYEPVKMKELGFYYESIGRQVVEKAESVSF